MKSVRLFACVFAALMMLLGGGAGCSSYDTIQVPVAPRVSLGQYQTIGLVTFASDKADNDMLRLATQQFLESVQYAQPGTRVLELGDEAHVFNSIDRKKWDVKTLSAIKKKHNVDAVFVGRFDVEKTKPNVSLDTVFKSLSVSSDVNGTMSAKLIETDSGATMWTNTAQRTSRVAAAQFDDHGRGGFGASDPKKTWGDMIGCLVDEVTDDFRTHYITKRVPKEAPQPQEQTASAEGQ